MITYEILKSNNNLNLLNCININIQIIVINNYIWIYEILKSNKILKMQLIIVKLIFNNKNNFYLVKDNN